MEIFNEETPLVRVHDALITKDLEPEMKDAMGQDTNDPTKAVMVSTEYRTNDRNYGTIVLLVNDKTKELEVYIGPNVTKGMEPEDKADWFNFLENLRQMVRGRLGFSVKDLSKLKYTMKGMAAIREGLFEGYYGTRKVSYSDQPMKTRLMIKHNRTLDENDARFRYIESLFVECEDGSRFKLPFTKLILGRAMARHCANGGTPYDAFGQHIGQMATDMNTLARFVRAVRGREYAGEARELCDEAIRHYTNLKAKAKHMISQRGYLEARDNYDPAEFTEAEVAVESIRDMFIEQSLDQRIEETLPILARLSSNTKKEEPMKEIDAFESWATKVLEGTWSLPDNPGAVKKLQDLMSKPLQVGPDAENAENALYDLVGDDQLFDLLGDLAMRDPDANIWDDEEVMSRIRELVPGIGTAQPPSDEPAAQPEEDEVAEQDLSFSGMGEAAGCNHTMEGEACPVHGLAECGMYESMELEKIRRLALSK